MTAQEKLDLLEDLIYDIGRMTRPTAPLERRK